MFTLLTPEALDMASEAARLLFAWLRGAIAGPALGGDVDLRGTLAKGDLPATVRERIALAIAEINGCEY
ncbi:hypothetical protein [Azospirillum sp. B4]|uniref:hypothetical protein n=1 Tax=Azospirillum sp. B4 TaxID=95605 RepID=UPI00034C82D9|nr:hypothetical protein [Azospirillum sp. B4]